jgi:DNA-binding NtrC family response regulator
VNRQKHDAADELVGQSPAIQLVREHLRRFARFRSPVLFLGESGVGKELAARSLHELGSQYRSGGFVCVDCAGELPDRLDRELFGATPRGAHDVAGPGLCLTMGSGTLLLDQVGTLPRELQGKLLRVLEAREVRSFGSISAHLVSARVLASSTSLLGLEGLRETLRHHVSAVSIHLPTLRDRLEDVPELSTTILQDFSAYHETALCSLSGAALRYLCNYSWPGNVRELKIVLEAAAMRSDEGMIDQDVLESVVEQVAWASPSEPPVENFVTREAHQTSSRPPSGATPSSVPDTLPDLERKLIVATYKRCNGNLAMASRELGVARTTLRDRLQRWGLLMKDEG